MSFIFLKRNRDTEKERERKRVKKMEAKLTRNGNDFSGLADAVAACGFSPCDASIRLHIYKKSNSFPLLFGSNFVLVAVLVLHFSISLSLYFVMSIRNAKTTEKDIFSLET